MVLSPGSRGLLLALLLLACGRPAAAQDAFWVPSDGPYGGDVTDLVILPDGSARALAQRRLYESRDGGASWREVDLAMPRGNLDRLVHDGDGRLYLSNSQPPWVYRSLDGGRTWEPFGEGLPYVPSGSPVLAGGPGGVVYAGPAFGLFGYDAGLYRTAPGDTAWRRTALPEGQAVAAMAVAPQGTLLASLYAYAVDCPCREGLARSGDGEHWEWVDVLGLDSVLVDTTAFAGLYALHFAGLAWTPDGTAFVVANWSILYDDYVSDEGALFRSRDGGTSWQQVSLPASWWRPRDVYTDAAGRLFVRADQGSLASDDEGETWWKLPAPLHALTSFPDGARLAAFGGLGVWRSDDEGRTWREATAGLGRAPVTHVAVAGGTVYAAAGEFFRKREGAAWEHRPVLGGQAATALLAGPGEAVYAAAGYLVAGSADEGTTWSLLPFDTTTVRAFARAPDGVLLAGTSIGLYRAPEGAHWEHLASSPPDIYDLAVSREGRIYVGAHASGAGVFRSDDSGVSWERLGTWPGTGLRAIGLGPAGTLLAATGEGVYRSADGGATWSRAVFDPEAASYDVRDVLAVDDTTFFAAAPAGVWQSTDGGLTWKTTGEGLPEGSTQALALDADGHLLAATGWAGLYRSAIPVAVAVEGAVPLPAQELLGAPYPNPASGPVAFPLTLRRPAFVRLRLYDLLGRAVATLHDGWLAAGEHVVHWRAAVPAGLYVARLEAGGTVHARSVLLVR